MRYKDLVHINAQFQNSINIGLDLDNDSKIEHYIPTETGLSYLDYHISQILDPDGDHSSMIIAPYGKGKSHAVLVLMSLLSRTDYSNYQKLINRIRQIDVDLYKKIMEIQDRHYLPVIISNTRGTLNQSLFQALDKAIIHEGIDHLVFKTEFTYAEERILEWKNKYPDTYKKFINDLKTRHISYNHFMEEIHSFDEKALDLFKEIHKSILSGAEFICQANMDVTEYYREVAIQLLKNYKIDGLFIVFDEFTKFLESRNEETVSNDMKIIQDLAELCNNSGNMYFQMILHKPISDYATMNKNVRNAFRGIEGRVSTYYFTSTLKNSFDLIENVLEKTNKYGFFKEKRKKEFLENANKLHGIPAFLNNFEPTYIQNHIIDSCYPLHPTTAYALIRVNEKVAQNERTLFTFLAKKSTYSLPSLLNRTIADNFIRIPDIYDYFRQQFLDEKDNMMISRIAAQSLSALDLIEDKHLIELIKTIAVLQIINESDYFPCRLSVLSIALGINKDQCSKQLRLLVDKEIITIRHSGDIQFRMNMNLDINSQINNLVNTKFNKIDLVSSLDDLYVNHFYYPRVYNMINNITRFYRVEFMNEADFLGIETFESYFQSHFADGVIINIIRGENNNQEKVYDHIKDIDEMRLVAIYPKKYHDYSLMVKHYLAIEYLLKDESFIDENMLIASELTLMLNDEREHINEILEDDYSVLTGNNAVLNTYPKEEIVQITGPNSKDRVLGNILQETFNHYPGNINLELLNKNNVKGSYKNARKAVVERILNDSINLENLGTSPEDTVINCILVATEAFSENSKLKPIIDRIQDFFRKGQGEFSTLYSELMNPPYGIRKGILPIFIAIGIKEMLSSIIVYHDNHEMKLDAHFLEMVNDNPQGFSYTIDHIDSQKRAYLEKLGELFNKEVHGTGTNDYNILLSGIKNWYVLLPKFTKQMIGSDESISNRSYKQLRKYLTKPNINASQFINSDLPRIAGSEDYHEILTRINEMKENLEHYLSRYFEYLKELVNTSLGFSKGTILTQSTVLWIDKHKKLLEENVLEDYVKSFIMLCNNSKNKNEYELINQIAYYFTSLFVEDWSSDTINLFKKSLNSLVDIEVEDKPDYNLDSILLTLNGKKIQKSFKFELTESSEFIEDFIENTMEDYGDLLSNEQKISLLVKVISKYM
ncbi:hypothetical protein BN3662_01106 [Clostridiales bacterium CHKCI006]|nr:hypothetical protein BN3662_01106 [Clostridiales bacterium CHKCI006]